MIKNNWKIKFLALSISIVLWFGVSLAQAGFFWYDDSREKVPILLKCEEIDVLKKQALYVLEAISNINTKCLDKNLINHTECITYVYVYKAMVTYFAILSSEKENKCSVASINRDLVPLPDQISVLLE